MDIHPGALKHGIAIEDLEHAVHNTMATDDLDDDLRLYLGLARNGSMLEVISVRREGNRDELVIHVMTMLAKHRRLLPGG